MPINTTTNNEFVDTSNVISFTLGSATDEATLHWRSLKDDWSRRNYLLNVTVPLSFISKHWSELNDDMRMVCITKQRLSINWLSTIWQLLRKDERLNCLRCQKLPTDFLLRHIPWGDKESYHYICLGQELDPEYVNTIIEVCDHVTVAIILQSQKIPMDQLTRFVRLATYSQCSKEEALMLLTNKPTKDLDFSNISMAELPKFLTHDIESVRDGAAIRFNQLTNEGATL